MIDKKDILSGQHIWFADKSNVGQIKVIDIDKDDIVHYTSYDGNQYQKDLSIPLSQMKNFYVNPADAIVQAQDWISKNLEVDPLDPTKLRPKQQLYICD